MDNNSELQPLKKHEYPFLINCFMCFCAIMFVIFVPQFLIYELPYHLRLNGEIEEAYKSFKFKDYLGAVKIYSKILQDHGNFKDGKINLIKSCFALCNVNEDFYALGLSYLQNDSYKVHEINEMQSFLPPQLVQNFKQIWKGS